MTGIDRGRRFFLLAAGSLGVTPFAFAQTRHAVPGGGSVMIPSPFRTNPSYPTHADRAPDALVAYRNWRSTMSGHPECDGMVGVGLPQKFDTLTAFSKSCGAALSIQWSSADELPGQPWDGNEKKFPWESADGPNGPEVIQKLSVHRVGFWGVFDEPSHRYAVQHRAGVNVAIFLYDKHGGLSGARRLADRIGKSFQA